MEYFIRFISFAILFTFIISAIFLAGKFQRSAIRFKFVWFMASAYLVSVLLIVLLAWWSVFSNRSLMAYYGCDFSLDLPDRFAQVATKNVSRVEQLIESNNEIGWPLKAIITHEVYMPYVLLFYIIVYCISLLWLRKRMDSH